MKLIYKKIALRLLFFLLRCFYLTYRIKENQPLLNEKMKKKEASYLIAHWHEAILFNLFYFKNKNIFALVSQSEDGQLISYMLGLNNIHSAYGSSTKAGVAGFITLIKALKKGYSVIITPDGPLGPAKQVKHGVIKLAQMSKKPIIPFKVQIDREWKFKSWDQMRLAKPFARIHVEFGEPIYFSHNEEMTEHADKLQRVLYAEEL